MQEQEKLNMNKRVIFGLLLLLVLLLSVSALADNSRPVNPYRKDAVAFEQIARKIRNQARRESDGPQKYNSDLQSGLYVTCNWAPSLYSTGSWNIALQGHGSWQVKEMIACLAMKDWDSDFTHVHWINTKAGKDDPVFMDSYTTPEIVTAGEYQVYFYVTYDDDTVAYYYHEFTISGENALESAIASVAAGCRASTQWQTALNLHDWLTHNMYYDTDYRFYGADSILRGYGVCDSYSKIYYLLCRESGIPVKRVANSNHSWNTIMLDGQWYYVDCTWDDPPGALTKVSGSEHHTYFCLNKELTALDHPESGSWSWYKDQEPSCTSLEANYIIHTGEWQKWGLYEWDYDAGNWKVNTLVGQAVLLLAGGETQFVLYPDGTWLWYMENGELKSTYAGEREMKLLEYCFSHSTLPFEGEWILVSAEASSTSITIRLSGWYIEGGGTLTLPTGLTVIDDEAFAEIASAALVIQPGCVTIGAGAFRDSGVRTVTIPWTVMQIADDAFDGCGKIIVKTDNPVAVQYAAGHGMLVVNP